MKEMASTISTIFFVLFILYACAPEDLGKTTAKVINAFEQERATPSAESEKR